MFPGEQKTVGDFASGNKDWLTDLAQDKKYDHDFHAGGLTVWPVD